MQTLNETEILSEKYMFSEGIKPTNRVVHLYMRLMSYSFDYERPQTLHHI